MKRGLNNKEKDVLKSLKEKGYFPEVKENIRWNGEAEYFAEVEELKVWISLSSPGDLNDLIKKHANSSTSAQKTTKI